MKSTIHLWLIISILNQQMLELEPQNYIAFQESNFSIINENPIKKEAFTILQNKCNVCHKRRNPFMVFKLKNMERRYKKIYNEVFVKKRMPKGKNIKLTKKEYEQLLNWIKSTKKVKNGN